MSERPCLRSSWSGKSSYHYRTGTTWAAKPTNDSVELEISADNSAAQQTRALHIETYISGTAQRMGRMVCENTIAQPAASASN